MAQMLGQQLFASVLGQGLAGGIESGCSSCHMGEAGADLSASPSRGCNGCGTGLGR